MLSSNQDSLLFIQRNKQKSLEEVALLLSKKPELNKEFILHQINGIQKAKKKLPAFYLNDTIIYPSILSMEQCSSEKTALYKSKLIKGDALIDLTGGFGIDSYYFSKEFKQVTYIEPDATLFNIATSNFKSLKANNIDIVNTNAETFLKKRTAKTDVIYIDPSRRNQNQRVFNLEACTPNVITLSDQLFTISDKILIKTAPFLDLKQGIDSLQFVTKVVVIAVNNECKEVLYLLEKNNTKEIEIETVNITHLNQHFNFKWDKESITCSQFSAPKTYLYEPNSAILKAGAFNTISNRFKVNKIAPNSHLYTNDKLLIDFPGRVFKIEGVCNYNWKAFKNLNLKRANITCRNFHEKPAAIKKKLQLKDGGENYLFATTDLENKPILIYCIKN